MNDKMLLRKIIEGALLAAAQPLTVKRLHELLIVKDDEEEQEPPAKEEIQAILEDIQADCKGRGYELVAVGTGWRFQVVAETAKWVNRLWEEKPQKYSRALLETLALIAYRQPITRGDIEEIRGVAVSSHIIKTLTEREWIKVVGYRDVPGRPSLYATTKQFLDYFNLTSLEQLPSLSEIADLEKMNPELQLDEGMEIPPTKDLPIDPEAEAEKAEAERLAAEAEQDQGETAEGEETEGDEDVVETNAESDEALAAQAEAELAAAIAQEEAELAAAEELEREMMVEEAK